MRLATREQVYKIDQRALQEMKVSLENLIEKAGVALAYAFLKHLNKDFESKKLKIGVWCGPGHNGADGRVMARELQNQHLQVQIFEGTDWDPSSVDVIVDAYFGVGLNREIEGALKVQIRKINAAQKTVVAVDLPSGLDANRGVVLGEAVRATWTLTVAPAKPGLYLQEGPVCAGKIRSVDIGFSKKNLSDNANTVFLIGSSGARRLLPPRKSTGNKSHFGHLLVLAGSAGMHGAARLVTEAAARMGCGYVSVCSPDEDLERFLRPDFLHLSLNEFFKSDLKKYHAVVVGPGLGVHETTQRILTHLQENHGKVLVDADALTVLAKHSHLALPAEWILTPHAGELSRFLGTPALELEQDRLGSVERAVRELNAHILFKGFRTVLGSKERLCVIGSGNVALAKAGSGDVLSGFIGSLMAQGLSTEKAAALGAYLHGFIADDWLRRGHSTRTLLASDLADLLDEAFRRLKKSP